MVTLRITIVSSLCIWLACVCCSRALCRLSQRARLCSFAHPFRFWRARCVATSPSRQRFVCRAQALTISRSCGAFGVALSSIKGRASVQPNSSFKADGYAAA